MHTDVRESILRFRECVSSCNQPFAKPVDIVERELEVDLGSRPFVNRLRHKPAVWSVALPPKMIGCQQEQPNGVKSEAIEFTAHGGVTQPD